MNYQITPASIGVNEIRFESDFHMYGPAVIGVTELNYNNAGIISGASILLNEQNYTFTSTPIAGSFTSVFLGDVVTHELGHFLGLAHSEVLNSSMFYASFSGQSSLADDDRAAIKSMYGPGAGKITGYVKGGNDIGILGVHVQAISARTGEIVSTFSKENGSFEIAGLDLQNTYYLYTSPMKNTAALPAYFVNVQDEFCPGAFTGSFYSECGSEHEGIPEAISLTSSVKTVDVGDVTINCSLKTQYDYNFEKVQLNFGRLQILNYGTEGIHQKAYVGYFRKSDINATTFSSPDKFEIDLTDFVSTGTQKYLRIQTISQAFANPLEFNVTVRKNGAGVAGSPLTRETSSDGVLVLDQSISVPLSTNAASNIFEIDIEAKKLSSEEQSYSIPDYLNFRSDSHWPYLVLLSITTATGPIVDSVSILSDNSSCLDAPFAYSVEQADISAEASTSNETNAATSATAGCGTIKPPSDGDSGSGPVTMALGFLLAVFISSAMKRKKNFLS